MEVIFEPKNGEPFAMEVDFYDTVREIKRKIEKHQGIPASHQARVLNGSALPDDGDIDSCAFLENTRVNLVVSKSPSATFNQTVHLRVKIATPQTHVVWIEMDVNDTVLKLKDRILEADTGLVGSSLTWSKLTVRYKGQELQYSRRLREYEVSEDSQMEVRVRRVKRLKVFVQSKCETKKIPVWVDPSDNVEVLRPLLKEMNEEYDFPLPPEYFFIHKQDVMDDDKSFRWNRVVQGDIIDVFPGSVISG